jgi:FkbM family methyltransferase
MINALKKLVRRTPLYGVIQRRRACSALHAWSELDARMAKFYSQFIGPGELCFDVGANVGNRSKVFLHLGARVVALEPQPQCTCVLASMFGGEPRFTLVESAVGEKPGEAEMMVSTASTISSMSPEWVGAVKKSGRFAEHSWDQRVVVPVTTLDCLIEQHGMPAFIKIDVEGYEYPVVRGLSRPVRALSLEFTPEMFDSIARCVEHLSSLGPVRLNYSVGETMQLALAEWLPARETLDQLARWRDDHEMFGDVYVRFEATASAGQRA